MLDHLSPAVGGRGARIVTPKTKLPGTKTAVRGFDIAGVPRIRTGR
jgi:hypothetical protein